MLEKSALIQFAESHHMAVLKGLDHVTVNKPFIFIIYIAPHTRQFSSAHILVDGVDLQKRNFRKSTNISAVVQHMSVSCDSLQNSRVLLQDNTSI